MKFTVVIPMDLFSDYEYNSASLLWEKKQGLGKGSPEGFYKKLGFKKTGQTIWGEKEIVLRIR